MADAHHPAVERPSGSGGQAGNACSVSFANHGTKQRRPLQRDLLATPFSTIQPRPSMSEQPTDPSLQ